MRFASNFVFTVDQVRRAEQVLLDRQSKTDQLMKEAARAVAAAAEVMLTAPRPRYIHGGRILLLVGSGGNGGDALYAGARLCASGRGVDAVLLGREGRVHEPALQAFTGQGGRVLDELPAPSQLPQRYLLVIDGILGIGGRGGVAPEVAGLLEGSFSLNPPVLAIDVPSGINADTGALPEKVEVPAHRPGEGDDALRTQLVPAHVRADVTVTFEGLRPAHAVAHDCGEVVIAPLSITVGNEKLELGAELFNQFTKDFSEGAPSIQFERAWPDPNPHFDWSASKQAELKTVGSYPINHPVEPRADSDKYSGGVVGVCAGSDAYRGAAVLCAAGAVRATSSMVRYIGSGWEEVVRALPEVVAHTDVESAGRVQAWVVGPGRGTDDRAQAELAQLLDREEALLIDADAITLLSQHADLREKLRARTAPALLTPHVGEFRRLAESLDVEIPDPAADRLAAVRAMAQHFDCGVLLKGRRTVIAYGVRVHVIDAGSSWGATAGSGDVLAGITGALMAQWESSMGKMRERYPEWDRGMLSDQYTEVETAVRVHSVAAALAAQTPEGPAPTSASRIAEAVPRANAWLSSRRQ